MHDYVQNLYAVHEAFFGTKLEPAVLKKVTGEVKKISRFLKTGETETILLCIILAESEGREMAIKELREYLGMEPAQFNPCIAALKRLAKLDLIEIQGGGLRRRRNVINNPQNCLIQPAPQLKLALESGDAKLLRAVQINTPGRFFQAFEKLNAGRKLAGYQLKDFLKKVDDLCRKGKAVPMIQVLRQKSISGLERFLILTAIQKALSGADAFEADELLRELLLGEPDLFFETMGRLKSGKMPAIEQGLLELYESDIMEGNNKVSLKIGRNMIPVLPDYLRNSGKKQVSSLFRRIAPEGIENVQLYYNPEVERQINTITSSLSDGNFNMLQNALQKKSLRRGLTIIFHGMSGTGKTDTVFQLARSSGRMILMAEPSEIKSMWIGESEKNLKQMFQEYRSLAQKSERTPILLFNEADALIQSRRQVKFGVDAHDNALQNLLLQELEEFEGIFIGTTNHIQNIDPAFERRILFKVEFSAPVPEVRTRILETKFNQFNPGWLQQIGQRFAVTGSQIENVRKKLAIESVLNQDFTPTLELLEDLFKNESFTPQVQRVKDSIGFKYGWMSVQGKN
jgi:hypothetical protein